jgi:tripartite-type tricarboxylate transporter receptor subunit TctC
VQLIWFFAAALNSANDTALSLAVYFYLEFTMLSSIVKSSQSNARLFSRRLAVGTALFGAMALCGNALYAQTGSVKLMVGFPPGGGTDAVARTLAEKLGPLLGTTVVVENKAGAGGQIAAQALKAASPDGTTFFLSHDHTISILPLVVKNPGFDPVKDFVPVAGFATFVNALAVSGGTPAKSFNEYVAWAKSQGNKGNVGVPAPASVPEFLVKVLGEKYKLDLQAAPYRGSAPMMADMLGNQIDAGVGSVPDFIENHKAGKIRVVAVLGASRQATLPDVPTFSELGLAGFEDVPYYGVFAPAGTPKAVVDRFSDALAKAVAMPDVKEKLTALGLTVAHSSSQQIDKNIQAYTQVWSRIIKASGFQAQ